MPDASAFAGKPPVVKPKPKVTKISPPRIVSPIPSDLRMALGVSKCGETYARDITLRIPVGGWDKHEITVPAIVSDDSWFTGEKQGVYERIWDLMEDIHSGLTRFQDVVKGEDRVAVMEYAKKSARAMEAAEKLDKWWREQFLPPAGEGEGKCRRDPLSKTQICEWTSDTRSRHLRGWPLWEKHFRPMCASYPPGTNIRGNPSFRCPYPADVHAHETDAALLRSLLQSSILWGRCAQERLYTVAVRERNRASIPKVTATIDGEEPAPRGHRPQPRQPTPVTPPPPRRAPTKLPLGAGKPTPPAPPTVPPSEPPINGAPPPEPAKPREKEVTPIHEEPPPGVEPDVPTAAWEGTVPPTEEEPAPEPRPDAPPPSKPTARPGIGFGAILAALVAGWALTR